MTLNHGDKVRYTGPTMPDFGVTHGGEYRTCGTYPQPPMKGWAPRDEVSVYVADPRDNFGGVVSLPAKYFETV